MYYCLVFSSVARLHCGCVVFIAASAVAFAQVSFFLLRKVFQTLHCAALQGYAAGFTYVLPLQMKGLSAAWEILVSLGIALLISGISNGLSNFVVVVTCIAVAVSWLTFSNVTAALLFLMLHLFLLMVSTCSCNIYSFSEFPHASLKIRLYRAIGGPLSFLAPVPLVSDCNTRWLLSSASVVAITITQVVLHMALGLIASVYPSQPLHVTRLLICVPVGLLLICQLLW
jgi:hypothetical protein